MIFFNFNLENLSEYDSFVSSFENALIFHSSKYLKFISSHLGFQLHLWGARDSQGQLQAVLAFGLKDGSLGKIINSMAYYGSNGGVLFRNRESGIFLVEKWNEFQSDFSSSTWIESPYINEDISAFITKNDCPTVRLTHFNHLSSKYDSDSLMNVYHYKTRNTVRKAMKSGIEIIEDTDDLETLYKIHKDNMLAIGGKPKDKTFFDSLPSSFEKEKDYKVFYAIKDNQKIAALMLFYYNKTVDYFTPVVVQEFRNLQPLSYLIHHTMLLAGHEGFLFWNWGGSWESQHSLIHFKERWGGEIRSYKYYTSINNPEVYRSNRQILEQDYPGFFVVPYDQLGNVK